MEKQTVYIKRYPSKGELPKAEQHVIVGWNEEPLSTRVANRSENGYWFLSDDACDCDEPDYWLEEIALPSEEYVCKGLDSSYKEWQYKGVVSNINESAAYKAGLVDTRNFILNHLKSNTNESNNKI